MEEGGGRRVPAFVVAGFAEASPVKILWILLPAPIVGYLIADSVRQIFSEDETLLRRQLAEQPVTMLAATTALGAVVVWVVVEVVGGVLARF